MYILKHYIKRCIGFPGNTFFIKEGKFRIEGATGLLRNLDSQERVGKSCLDDFGPGAYPSYPCDSALDWNIRDFDPIYILQCGNTVSMNRPVYVLYRKPIEWETGCKLGIRDTAFCVNDIIITTYRFRKNYFLWQRAEERTRRISVTGVFCTMNMW